MDILSLKRKALGYTLQADTWGGSGDSGGTSDTGSSTTWSDASGTVTTTADGVSWSGTGGFDKQAAGKQFALGLLTGNPIVAGIKGLMAGASGYTPGGSASYDGTTSGGGSMDNIFSSGNIGNAITIAGGINSLSNASGNIDTGVQRAGDPFAAYRSNLAQMYAGALSQGGQVDPTKMPGYSQWKSGVLDPSMEATQGRLAASGYGGGSGVEKQALQDVAQRGYYGFMTDYMNRLAQGSGAVNNPATAAGLGVQQGNMNQQATMQGIGAIGQGLAGYFGNATPSYTDMTGFYTPSSGTNWVGSAAQSSPPMTSVLGSDWGAGAYDIPLLY